MLEPRIHLLLVDPFPPGPRPQRRSRGYCDVVIRAYIDPVAVGDLLPETPLFLEPNGCVKIPLEATYHTAFAVMPRRWRDKLQPPAAC